MKQQILWVVERRDRWGSNWVVDEAFSTRHDAREAVEAWRMTSMEVRIVKYIRSE